MNDETIPVGECTELPLIVGWMWYVGALVKRSLTFTPPRDLTPNPLDSLPLDPNIWS